MEQGFVPPPTASQPLQPQGSPVVLAPQQPVYSQEYVYAQQPQYFYPNTQGQPLQQPPYPDQQPQYFYPTQEQPQHPYFQYAQEYPYPAQQAPLPPQGFVMIAPTAQVNQHNSLRMSHEVAKEGLRASSSGLTVLKGSGLNIPSEDIEGEYMPTEFAGLVPGMREEDLIEDLMYRYAPEVRLYSKDINLPSSVHWYLDRCKLCFNEGKNMDNPVIIETVGSSQEDLDRFVSASHEYKGKTWTSIGGEEINDRNPWYLLRDDKRFKEAAFGQRDLIERGGVPIYVNVNTSSPDEIDFQYWCFYPHNGPNAHMTSLLPKGTGEHQGDWEHSCVVVSRTSYTINAIFCDAHGSEGQWYLQPATSMTSHDGYIMGDNGHPILYSASGGHGHYGWAARQFRGPGGLPTPIDDGTDDDGLHWKSWKNLIRLSIPRETATGSQKWLYFSGDWGRPHMKGDFIHEGGGPCSPSMKTSIWKRDWGCEPPDSKSARPFLPSEDFQSCGLTREDTTFMLTTAEKKGLPAGLEILLCNRFTKIWDSKGTGAKAGSISFFRPVPPAGYYCFGDLAQRTPFSMPKNGCVLALKDVTPQGSTPLLVKPTGFSKVWDTRGTNSTYGDKKGLSVWHPLAPAGYVAMGDIVVPGVDVTPDPDLVRCIHESLVVQGRFDTKKSPTGWLWSDQGSGAKNDLSIWVVAKEAMMSAPAGTFIGSPNWNAPQASTAHCLRFEYHATTEEEAKEEDAKEKEKDEKGEKEEEAS